MYENEIVSEVETPAIDYAKSVRSLVFSALTGADNLRETANGLIERFGIENDPVPSMVDVAREAQELYIDIDDNAISPELAESRLKQLLKRVVAATAEIKAGNDEI